MNLSIEQIITLCTALIGGIGASVVASWAFIQPKVRQAYEQGRADALAAFADEKDKLTQRLKNHEDRITNLEKDRNEARTLLFRIGTLSARASLTEIEELAKKAHDLLD